MYDDILRRFRGDADGNVELTMSIYILGICSIMKVELVLSMCSLYSAFVPASGR